MLSSHHHENEQNYPYELVEVTDASGVKNDQRARLLRVYPEPFNGYDAYMEIPMNGKKPDIRTVHSSRLSTTWEVIQGPQESPIEGHFRGDYGKNNPPAWVFGLKRN